MVYSLLNEPIIELDGFPSITLPALFADWSSRGRATLAGLQAHQRPSMHMFMCQLGTMAVQRDTVHGDCVEADEHIWRDRLLRLAPEPAWHVVQDDMSLPAMMQVPIPVGGEESYNKEVMSPGDITSLQFRTKNHTVKKIYECNPSPWDWVVALVDHQTMSGYPGAGNYGICRMNGGWGSRPLVSSYQDMSDGARWLRDVTALLLPQPHALEGLFSPAGTGVACLWTLPWDGAQSMEMSDMDPLGIEVCRLVRLVRTGGRISAVRANSKTKRLAMHKDLAGVTGEGWAPIRQDKDGRKLFTISPDGFDLPTLCGLMGLSPEMTIMRSPLSAPMKHETGDILFHAAVLCGGQGKTGGFHEVTLPIPGKIIARGLLSLAGAPTMADTAQAMIRQAKDAQNALKGALRLFMAGDGSFDTSGRDDGRFAAVRDRLENDVKDGFFPYLWQADETGHTDTWSAYLVTRCREVFLFGCNSVSTKSGNRYRGRADGERYMEMALRREGLIPRTQTQGTDMTEGVQTA